MTQPNSLGRILRYFTSAWSYSKAADGVRLRSVADILEPMSRGGLWGGTGELVDVDTASKLAAGTYATYAAIKLIADRAAAAPFTATRQVAMDAEPESLPAHPFAALQRRPNSIMSGSFLARYTYWWYLLRGNAYIWIATSGQGTGEPLEFWPLPADMVTPEPSSMRDGRGVFRGEQVIDYTYTPLGFQKVTLPGENVVHFRAPNPFDYWTGLSPLTSALVTMQMDYSQAEWIRDFFDKRNAVPTAILSVPAETNEQDFDVIREMLKEQFEAGQKTLVTRAGDLTVQIIQQTLEQMQVLATREFNAKVIDRIYGIPEGLITAALSGDSRLAAEIAFARNALQPMLSYFAEEWTAQLSPYYGDEIIIAADNVVPQDRALELSEYTQYGQDRTINENRAERGLNPLDNDLADQVPVRLLQWVAPNYATLDGAEPEQDEAPPMVGAVPGVPGVPGLEGAQEQPQIGAQAGQQTPEEQIIAMVGKAPVSSNGHNPALALALRTELQRWRKVAIKEAKSGNNPAEREFVSDVVPAELAAELRAVLDGADETRVKAAFEPHMTTDDTTPHDDDTLTAGEAKAFERVAAEYARAADALEGLLRHVAE